MKKINTFLNDLLLVLRGLMAFCFVIFPGVIAFIYWYCFKCVPTELAIAGALGVEFVWCIAFTVFALLREAWQDVRKRKREGSDEYTK